MKEYIKIENIETPEAVRGFRELIEEEKESSYQTIFLNGKWGSGKTTFLEKVSESNKQSFKFIYLKLWETRDERTVIQIAFKELHKFYYWLMKLSVIVCVVISLLLTPAFNIGLSKFLSDPVCKGVIVAISLSVSVAQLFKIKSDNFYVVFFNLLNGRKIHCRKWFLEKLSRYSKLKVLVIDDFDRVEQQKQLEAYKLFNILHGMLPIIFIGDYEKLVGQKDISFEYLSKIIDRRVELPFLLSSTKIAANISKQVINLMEKEYDLDYDKFISKVFLTSRFSIREWEKYVEILNDQINKKGGPKSIQVHELSVIVYLYLFYPLDYQELTRNYDNNYKFNRKKGSTHFNEVKEGSDKYYIKKVILPIGGNATFPRTFYENAKMYFLDDYVSNLSKAEADEILGNPDKLKNKLLEEKMDEDLYYYIQSLHSNVLDNSNQVLNCIFSTIKSNPNIQSQLIQSIIDIFVTENKNDYQIFELFEKYTNEFNFKIEEKCNFYIKFGYANELISDILYQKIMDKIEQLNNENSKYKLEMIDMLLIGTKININDCQAIINKLTKNLTREELGNLLEILSNQIEEINYFLWNTFDPKELNKLITIISFKIFLKSSSDRLGINKTSIRYISRYLKGEEEKRLLMELTRELSKFEESPDCTIDKFIKVLKDVQQIIVNKYPELKNTNSLN